MKKIHNDKHKKNFHIVYGKHAIQAVLQNDNRIIYKLYIQSDLKDKIQITKNIKIEYVSKDTLSKMCKDGDKHQGYLAHVSSLIESLKLEDYIDIFSRQNKASIVILDQINDPHNLGAILRSARCFNIDLVIITKYNMPEINASVIRSSAGMSEYVNILTVTNINNTLQTLQNSGFYTIALDLNAQSRKISNITNENKKIAFVMGSEGYGIRQSIRDTCHETLQIQINPDSDSLNVSNAAAIMMYEIFNS
ncbi:23S rRNA (guanosine(2251)-2'-O)-methyltransferase RlmB [Candidatus Deianiraea vastatrix]|uniref:23S rRNA (Guanosine(2251)-2'-O)-methyltransferase RlmB n=1 Tax=Candidatus Deianiraea vastatrix TaxID=2163644 RepID=A0A5B8XJ60_9RICK|nr:23S rRNA (guanosine(2251)-2'-O)-methyltransferase RlmB [Candidatus Deianiraea vastatrix]QED23647.1 23S rRNA (guanosine(2251)-2'-O)-methyltransferase RlmB [Candidatus Deianiraea vastatrix]